MEEDSDIQLLRRFAARGDEAAFTELVERHAPMVRGVALRSTGGHVELADEIVQSVFTVLARKASLVPAGRLAGWLHNVAVLEAKNALRKAGRHRRAVRELGVHTFSDMNTFSSHSPENASPWEDIRPHLDAALARLPEKTRHPVVLRYFENRSIREIAFDTGKSEHAVRKEIERALERLSVLLKRRGVSTTGSTLAAALSAQTLCAPPASAALLATAALRAASLLSSSSAPLFPSFASVMAAAQTKTAAVAAALLLATVPSALLRHRNTSPQSVPRTGQAQETARGARADSPLENNPEKQKAGTAAGDRVLSSAERMRLLFDGAMNRRRPPPPSRETVLGWIARGGGSAGAVALGSRMLRDRTLLPPAPDDGVEPVEIILARHAFAADDILTKGLSAARKTETAREMLLHAESVIRAEPGNLHGYVLKAQALQYSGDTAEAIQTIVGANCAVHNSYTAEAKLIMFDFLRLETGLPAAGAYLKAGSTEYGAISGALPGLIAATVREFRDNRELKRHPGAAALQAAAMLKAVDTSGTSSLVERLELLSHENQILSALPRDADLSPYINMSREEYADAHRRERLRTEEHHKAMNRVLEEGAPEEVRLLLDSILKAGEAAAAEALFESGPLSGYRADG